MPDTPVPDAYTGHPESPTDPCHPESAVADEGSPPAAAPARRRYTLSPRAVAARRANRQKARAAPRERIYRPTEKRRAASRANLQKALAGRRSPAGNARARLNALKHGLHARRLEESIRRLNESAEEYAAHRQLFDRIYLPQDDLERRLIRRLADATWRRLRLFHAQARWEAERLWRAFGEAPATDRLTPDETERRVWALVCLLHDWRAFLREAAELESEIENLLRRLLRHRAPESPVPAMLAPRRERFVQEVEEMPLEEFMERWQNLTPERQAQILRQVNARVAKKMAGAGGGEQGNR